MSGTKVDLETLRAAITEYKSILDDLKHSKQVGTALTRVEGAGLDRPSTVYAGAANQAGFMHQQANEDLQDTLLARIENLEATLRQYEQTEQGNETKLKPRD